MIQLKTVTDTEQLLNQLIDIEAEASHKIMTIYHQGDFDVQQKNDNSPVTRADHIAHQVILNGLKKLTPEIPVLSEEGPQYPFEVRKKWPLYWLVDPLDGTRDFIARTDSFSVNIALIKNHKPVMGVIYLPVSEECFFAAQDMGAFKVIPNRALKQISSRAMTSQIPIITVSGCRNGSVLNDCLKNLKHFDMQYMGSSIKSCRVAEGKIDWYPCLGPTSEWDTAAAQCIVEEAGGSLTDLNNNPLRYNTKKDLLNPWFMACGDPKYNWHALVPKELESA